MFYHVDYLYRDYVGIVYNAMLSFLLLNNGWSSRLLRSLTITQTNIFPQPNPVKFKLVGIIIGKQYTTLTVRWNLI